MSERKAIIITVIPCYNTARHIREVVVKAERLVDEVMAKARLLHME